jgi:phenylalanyl-tRNA synthetase alpha chain
MLNLVEYAAGPDGYQIDRLQALAKGAMEAVGLEGYSIETRDSGVYGTTVDIEYDGLEIASGAYGPHPLDANWGVFETWVGLGIGIERLAMVLGGYQTIKPVSKSCGYIDGISLRLN